MNNPSFFNARFLLPVFAVAIIIGVITNSQSDAVRKSESINGAKEAGASASPKSTIEPDEAVDLAPSAKATAAEDEQMAKAAADKVAAAARAEADAAKRKVKVEADKLEAAARAVADAAERKAKAEAEKLETAARAVADAAERKAKAEADKLAATAKAEADAAERKAKAEADKLAATAKAEADAAERKATAVANTLAVTTSGTGFEESVADDENKGTTTKPTKELTKTTVASAGDSSIPQYVVRDGMVDKATYNGYRRFHGTCHACHGQDAAGGSFAPSLVDSLKKIDYGVFHKTVTEGRIATGPTGAASVMPAFSNDPNVMKHLDDIYRYLAGRADGAIGAGRPTRFR